MCKQTLSAVTFVLGCIVTTVGCWRADDDEVVVYSALDRQFAEPILRGTRVIGMSQSAPILMSSRPKPWVWSRV